MSSWIAVAGPWLRGSLVVSFLLGRNLVIPKDELLYILCIRMSTFPYGIGPPWEGEIDTSFCSWEDRMEDWVIIWHSILFENVIGN